MIEAKYQIDGLVSITIPPFRGAFDAIRNQQLLFLTVPMRIKPKSIYLLQIPQEHSPNMLERTKERPPCIQGMVV